MPRFNQKRSPRQDQIDLESREDATVNYEGGLAFKVTPELELVQRCCAAMMGEPKFYESGKDDLRVIRELSEKTNTDFLLSLAHYVRKEMKLRTSAILLYTLAAMRGSEHFTPNHKSNVRDYGPKVLIRADEPSEAIGAWLALHSGQKQKRWSRSFLKGIADALGTFDEYQLAKHDHGGASVKLRDVIQIVHPKPKDEEQAALYKRALEGTLKTPETWETKLSATKGESKQQAWDDIAEKMGLMALVRNLRNFEQQKAEKAIKIAIEKLGNSNIVQKSRMLPFRFLEAINHVSATSLQDALRGAVELSVANMPKWPGKTAVFVDLSGSMEWEASRQSGITLKRIASLMGAMSLHMSDEAFVGGFACEYKRVKLSKRDSILSNAEKIAALQVGGSTNAYLAIEDLLIRKEKYDRVVIFTDMQTYDSLSSGRSVAAAWRQYARQFPKAVLFNCNLSGYGTAHIPENEPNVVHLTGWSEGIMDFISKFGDMAELVNVIREKW